MSSRKPKLPPRRPTLIDEGLPKRYRLHTERKVLDENGKVRKWTYGTKDNSKPNKIVLLVGETGTGKTTLINTMVNYLLGVKFEDEKWYEITEEAAEDQAESQTSEITMYEVFPFSSSTPVSLTIIDTPGYGDTRGLEKDLEVAENLSSLFQSEDGVCEIDAVCFVIQASKNRLSDRQHYIISSVLSLFGKDIVNNIVFLITHSDGLPPKNVLHAIKKAKIPCRRDRKDQPVYFLFNNRQADTRVKRYIQAQSGAWKNSMDAMQDFVHSLNEMKRKSLELTSDVLTERIQFESSIFNLQLRVQERELKKAEKLQIQDAMIHNKKMIEECKNFKINVKKTVKTKVPIEIASWKSRKATTCTVCEENCHEFDCWWVSGPSKCEVMKNGYCTVCSGKCHHSKHVKENKKYVVSISSIMMEFDSIKKEYDKAQEQTEVYKVLMGYLDKDLKEIEKQKSDLLSEAYQTIKHLSQIALKPDSAFTLQHLDFFIPRVKEAGKEDWVQELEEMRRTAVAEETNKDALSYLRAGLMKLFLGKQ